ncbi:hypothetical protein B7R54_02390 [Subtercola boreus]|uniref:CAAX protease n=2 Tax=Subtercola boreus TaxID=120213 RepID=A0A3E0VEW3_9MICO|nr:Abi family protein [Subtercola boreus]RFA08195.1 hypothetical protein B7R54_02390 [Subtercola boreus]TQL54911.1 Abi-like protein [Subtercola boreus]
MQRYDLACRHNPEVDGVELYVWARSVALALFDDIGHVEIAMRSAMAKEMARTYGLTWYEQDAILDDGTLELIDEAKRRSRVRDLPNDSALIHGKVVASLMLGFWVKLLGRGMYREHGDQRNRRIHDTLIWKAAAHRAFPNVDELARQRVEGVARYVQTLRNRIAHHEHVVWGVPIAGEKDVRGNSVRLSLGAAHENVFVLASFIDRGFASWLRENSAVQSRIDACPIYAGELMLIDEMRA